MPEETDPLGTLPPMIRACDLAPFLGVAEQQLADWRKQGVGPPYVKLTPGRGGAVRYPREDLRAYLASNTRNALSAEVS